MNTIFCLFALVLATDITDKSAPVAHPENFQDVETRIGAPTSDDKDVVAVDTISPAIGAESPNVFGKYQLEYLKTRTPMTLVTSSGKSVLVKSLPESAQKIVLTTRIEQSVDLGEIDVGEFDSSEKMTTVVFKETFRVVRHDGTVWLLNLEEQRVLENHATSEYFPWMTRQTFEELPFYVLVLCLFSVVFYYVGEASSSWFLNFCWGVLLVIIACIVGSVDTLKPIAIAVLMTAMWLGTLRGVRKKKKSMKENAIYL